MTRWAGLKRFTPARVALGRSGDSLPTAALLDFELAHAQARDAVHAALNVEKVESELQSSGWQTLRVHSAARDRAEYLRRPDLARELSPGSVLAPGSPAPELLFIVGDGLSALAAQTHAVPLLAAIQPRLGNWRVGPVVIATQARVALGDRIGEALCARIVVMLIGERPGLSAPDSLGIYITYDPRRGRSDAQRNCISNVREAGLTCDLAGYRLLHLLENARRLGLTGIGLKDESTASLLP